jgi:hypothetical protein
VVRELTDLEIQDVAGGPIPVAAYYIGAGVVALGLIAVGYFSAHNTADDEKK